MPRTRRWNQIIYGDGGLSGFSSTNDALRFNTFTGQANDANFQNGDPTKWVIISAPIISSPEGAFFYPPVVADPHKANGGTIFQGSFSVWRTQDWGGNQAFLEANCPEFTTSATKLGCGDFVQIGPAGATDLTDTFAVHYGAGSPRQRARVDSAHPEPTPAPPGWRRVLAVCSFPTTPMRPRHRSSGTGSITSGLPTAPRGTSARSAVDPANVHHGWVSYSGYNVNTPATPGHVFEVTWGGTGVAAWTDRQLQPAGLPDHGLSSATT